MLERHDFAPDFVAATPGGERTRFYGVAGGRVAVLAFCPPPDLLAELAALAGDTGAPLFAVHARAPAAATDGAVELVDVDGAVRARYGAGDEPRVLVLSENLRVVAACADAAGARDAIGGYEGPGEPAHAPVLMIPDALDAAFCDRLIAIADERGGELTGVELSREGRRVDELQAAMKRRRDHVVVDADLMKEITRRVGKRVIPEVHKAFSFHATRFEGFKICCYEGDDRGFFTRHRDNLSPGTAHRRFALTLNLNDDYEGGHLQFPEYGPARYRPGRGGAVVFSGSLMHEALEVTRGRRYVLLSFLYGEGDRARKPR